MGQPYIDQDSFRWRKDDGGEVAATWHELVNIDWSSPVLDQIVRLRFLLQNTGEKDLADGYRLEYNVNGGGWNPVTAASSYVRSCGSANTTWTLTDEDATSQIIGGGTFDEGYWDDTGTTTSFTFAQTEESELEFCFQFRSAEMPGGATVELRVAFDDGSALDLYSNETSVTFPSGEFQQNSFRIRAGDTDSLNGTTDWAAAESTDAEVDVEKVFRIRFEVQETASVSRSATMKLQYRKNAGSWTDLTVHADPWTATANPAIFITDSAQYNDGDATSNVLTNSAKAFTAGTGEENNITATVTLNNQHTELEWSLYMRSFYDGAGQNDADDYFEFRIVESDDTVFDGVYDIPRIDCTVPAGLIGGTTPESPNRILAVDTNGSIYALIEATDTGAIVIMIKSTDGGDSWAEMDGGNRPSNNDLESVDVAKDGDTLHILHQRSNVDVYYHRFRMSDHATNPDTWEVTDQVVLTGASALEDSVAVEGRSDGTVVGFYRRTDTTEQIKYKIRSSGGVWGAENDLDTEGSTDFTAVSVVKGASDKIHIFYKDNTNGYLYHNALSSGDALSGRVLVHNDCGTGNTPQKNIVPPIYWDDGGDEKIMVGVRDESDSYVYTSIITNDGAPSAVAQASDNAILDSAGLTALQPVASLAINGTDAYLHYSDETAWDIYRDTNANGAGWGTDTEEQDAVTCAAIRSLAFTHSGGNGGATVVAYIWDIGSNGGTGALRYDEYELAGATVSFSATIIANSATPDDPVLAIKRGMVASLLAGSATPDDPVLAVARAFSATSLAASVTPDDVALAFMINLAATLTGVSSTPDDVVLGIARGLVAEALAASTTPDDATLAVERAMTAALLGASITPDDVVLGLALPLSATLLAASVTPDDVALAFLVNLAADLLAGSATPDDVALALQVGFAAESLAASITPDDVALAVTRGMIAAALAGSLTPDDVGLILQVGFAAVLTAASTTPDDVSLAVARAMLATILAQSITPDDVDLDIGAGMVYFDAILTAASTTPDDPVLAISRPLAAILTAASATPDDVTLGYLVALTAELLAASITPDDVVLAVLRAMTSTLTAVSTTPDDVLLGLELPFSASLLAASTSPDNVALSVLWGMSASLLAQSVTPDDVALIIARAFAASILAQSQAPDAVVLAVARPLAATLTAQSVTPDNVSLLLAILYGLIYANFAGRSPGAAFGGRTPGLTFTGRDPGSEVTGKGG